MYIDVVLNDEYYPIVTISDLVPYLDTMQTFPVALTTDNTQIIRFG